VAFASKTSQAYRGAATFREGDQVLESKLRSSGIEIYGSGGGAIPHTAIFDTSRGSGLWLQAANCALIPNPSRLLISKTPGDGETGPFAAEGAENIKAFSLRDPCVSA